MGTDTLRRHLLHCDKVLQANHLHIKFDLLNEKARRKPDQNLRLQTGMNIDLGLLGLRILETNCKGVELVCELKRTNLSYLAVTETKK